MSRQAGRGALALALVLFARGHAAQPVSLLVDNAGGEYLLPPGAAPHAELTQEGLTATLAALLALPQGMSAAAAREARRAPAAPALP